MVSDDDTLDLGGRILEFAEIPNVHWPDTMVTFDHQTGTLFSCDAFGSYGRVDHGNYDDMLSEEDLQWYEEEAVRYYANIVASFSPFVEKAIKKCESLPIKIIAPGHGIVWRKDPMRIVRIMPAMPSVKKSRNQGNYLAVGLYVWHDRKGCQPYLGLLKAL